MSDLERMQSISDEERLGVYYQNLLEHEEKWYQQDITFQQSSWDRIRRAYIRYIAASQQSEFETKLQLIKREGFREYVPPLAALPLS